MKPAKDGMNGIQPFLESLERIPFVRKIRFAPSRENQDHDGILTIQDPGRRRFEFLTEVRRSYLDHATANALAAKAARRVGRRQQTPHVLLFARYIPTPTAERLLEAGVNFLDLAGNMHFAIDTRYSRTIIGKPAAKPHREHPGLTAAQLQVLILFATEPNAASWPVRDIASRAGVSKSLAAEVRHQMVADGTLERRADGYRLPIPRKIEELILTGYSRVLRPKLLVGRFQTNVSDPGEFVRRTFSIPRRPARFSLTGGPAADVLHPYYRGHVTPLFASDSGPDVRRALRLLPDANGPITILRAFGDVVFWRDLAAVTVAPPWLVYAELMQSADPRAHEAGQEFKREFLAS